MAKLSANVVPVSDIAWLRHRNTRHNYGTDKERETTIVALYHGWEDHFPCQVTNLTEDDKAKEVEIRLQHWNDLKAAASNADGIIRLKAFETLYVSGNKVKEPKYLGNTANRRGSCLEEIMFRRLKKDEPVWDSIPVTFKSFSSESERISAQIFENVGRKNGAKDYEPQEMVSATWLLYKMGASEADIGRKTGISRGTCQKLHRLFSLDNAFPQVELVKRVLLPATDERYIHWGSLDKESVLKLLLDCCEPGKALEKGRPVTNAENVESFLKALKDGEPEVVKAMTKDNFQNVGKQTPAQVIKDVVEAYMKNDTDGLVVHTNCAEGYNLVTKLYKEGKLEAAIAALKAL